MLAAFAAPLCLLLATADAPPARGAPAPAPVAERLLDPVGAWRAARWGMTEAEVLAAFPGRARRLERPEPLADGKVVSLELEPWTVADLPARVRFVFEGGKLALVSLKTTGPKLAEWSHYDRLKAQLRAELDQQGDEGGREESFQFQEIHFAAGGNQVDLKYLKGTLVLLYHPVGG